MANESASQPRSAAHILAKPIGPACNYACTYCFYLEKEKLYPRKKAPQDFRMSDAVLENFTRQHIAQHGPEAEEITFAWQGGEPTLMGLDFFKRAVELQQKYGGANRRIANALQTNGSQLDDDWCRFFRSEKFLIGLSIDGPKALHDRHRVDQAGHGTHGAVMRGWKLLKQHGVEYNTLTVVHRHNGDHPLEVYDFLKANGSRFMQFIPLVERADANAASLAGPPLLRVSPGPPVTSWSVGAEQYGDFIIKIFDRWVRHDVGRYFVQLFDVQLGIEMGLGSSLCVFAETCGRALALEHNGDLYACDHYVYPEFKLGNLMEQPEWATPSDAPLIPSAGTPGEGEGGGNRDPVGVRPPPQPSPRVPGEGEIPTPLKIMADSLQQQRFGNDKRDTLPAYCRRCEVLRHCHGECPKHRFTLTPDGEPGLNYLCAGYKKLFTHMKPHLRTMADLLRQRRAPAEIMNLLPCGGR